MAEPTETHSLVHVGASVITKLIAEAICQIQRQASKTNTQRQRREREGERERRVWANDVHGGQKLPAVGTKTTFSGFGPTGGSGSGPSGSGSGSGPCEQRSAAVRQEIQHRRMQTVKDPERQRGRETNRRPKLKETGSHRSRSGLWLRWCGCRLGLRRRRHGAGLWLRLRVGPLRTAQDVR